MKIGTEFCGKVGAIDDESIQTKFFVLGLPIVPLESFYVLEEKVNGVRGFAIESHGPSVVAAYLRYWSFGVAVFAGVYAALGRRQEALWIVVVIAAAIWAYAMFGYGKVSDREFCRRVALAAETGLRAPPEILPIKMRLELNASLREKMEAASLGTGAEDHRELPDRSKYLLLHAYAAYADPEGRGEFGKLAERVLAAILADPSYREAFGARAPQSTR